MKQLTLVKYGYLEKRIQYKLKRILDICLSLLVLAVVTPVLALLVFILQQVYSPGPLFFRQKRVGHNGRHFEIVKFRSMNCSSLGCDAVHDDSRVFPAGNFLRKHYLDEFPQFANVLRGEMSVVGPRPHAIDEDAEFSAMALKYKNRRVVKPGITGLAQIMGYRGATDNQSKLVCRFRLDDLYIARWSLLLDLKIVAVTFMRVISPKATNN